MRPTRNMTREERAAYYKKQKTKSIITLIATVVFFVAVAAFAFHVITHLEQFSTVEQSYLLSAINDGDEAAIERYKSVYIEDDIYLFSGPMTIKLCCEKYGFDIDEVTEGFITSGCDNFQHYFNRYLR